MSTTQLNKYKCPFCVLQYEDERLVRTHISLSTDDAHKRKNGVLTTVEAVGGDGDVIEELEGEGTIQAEGMDETVPAEAFPSSLTDKQLAVLQTAVRNANVDSLTEIERRVEELYDVDVSYQTVRKTVQDFFVSADDDDEVKTYDELTAKQQAIIDTMASSPNPSYSEVADTVGVSRAYPTRVEEEHESLIEERETQLIEMPETPEMTDEEVAVVNQLRKEDDPFNPSRSYSEIAEQVGVNVNVVSQLIHGHKQGVKDELEREDFKNKKGMTASPSMKQFVPENADQQESHSVDDETDDSDNKQSVDDSAGQQQDKRFESQQAEQQQSLDESTQQTVRRDDDLMSELESLLESVQSQKRIAETELNHSDSEIAIGKLAVTDEIESELEQLVPDSSL